MALDKVFIMKYRSFPAGLAGPVAVVTDRDSELGLLARRELDALGVPHCAVIIEPSASLQQMIAELELLQPRGIVVASLWPNVVAYLSNSYSCPLVELEGLGSFAGVTAQACLEAMLCRGAREPALIGETPRLGSTIELLRSAGMIVRMNAVHPYTRFRGMSGCLLEDNFRAALAGGRDLLLLAPLPANESELVRIIGDEPRRVFVAGPLPAGAIATSGIFNYIMPLLSPVVARLLQRFAP